MNQITKGIIARFLPGSTWQTPAGSRSIRTAHRVANPPVYAIVESDCFTEQRDIEREVEIAGSSVHCRSSHRDESIGDEYPVHPSPDQKSTADRKRDPGPYAATFNLPQRYRWDCPSHRLPQERIVPSRSRTVRIGGTCDGE